MIDTFKNYNPDIVFFGHTKNIELNTFDTFKTINKNLILSQWNEDPMTMHVMPTIKTIIFKY